MITQTDAIRNHMIVNGSITALEAFNNYGCMRLAARVNDLRKLGYIIETQTEKKRGKRWARYHLIGRV